MIDELAHLPYLEEVTVRRDMYEGEMVPAMLFELKYYNNSDDLVHDRPQTLRVWMLRDQAVALAEAIVRAA